MHGIKENIIKALKTVNRLPIELADFTYPGDPALGDIALPVFKLAKSLKKSPQQISKDWADKLVGTIHGVRSVAAVDGYVNFFLDTDALAGELLTSISKKSMAFGNAPAKRKKSKVLVEFVSPNSNKPLHLGHLRNAALGEAVARLFESQGKNVVRASLVNDRGIHICKAMVAYERFGKIIKEGGKIILDSPEVSEKKGDHFVGKYYVLYDHELKINPELDKEARGCLAKWEAGEEGTVKIWRTMRNWVLGGFMETYKILGIAFDRFDYESDIWKFGRKIAEDGFKKRIFQKESNGALVVKLDKFELPDKVLLRADGTSIYITTDLYLAEKRYKEEKFDGLVYVVGSEQDLYFKQLFAVFKLLQTPYAGATHHLSYGMVFLPEGKMKSREGTVVDADDLVAKLQEYATEEVKARHDFLSSEEVGRRARVIALAALKYYLLAVNPPRTMHFNPKESISFTGKTGPYLLYTLARTKSIMKKSAPTSILPLKAGGGRRGYGKYLVEKEERILVIEMAKFPEVLARAAKTLDPEEVATYLYNLAKKFSDFYEKHQVLDSELETRKARLALVQALSIVIEKGLYTLGIETLNEM